MNKTIIICLVVFIALKAGAQQTGSFNGIDVNMDNLPSGDELEVN